MSSPKRGQIWSYKTPGNDLCETGLAVRWFDKNCSLCVLNRDYLVAFLRDECPDEEVETFPGGCVKYVAPDAGPEHCDISSPYPRNVPPVCTEEDLGFTRLQEQIASFQMSPRPKIYKIQSNSLYGKFGTPEKRPVWKKLRLFLRTFFSSLSVSNRVGPVGAFRYARAWAFPPPIKTLNALEGARRFEKAMTDEETP